MKKKLLLFLTLVLMTMGLAACGADESPAEPDAGAKEDIFIGETSIGDYTLTYEGSGAKEEAKLLADYIYRACGKTVMVTSGGGDHTITLAVDKDVTEPYYEITGGNVLITGDTKNSLLSETYVFINTYLGYMYAGTDREAISDEKTSLHIPTEDTTGAPWIEEREAIVTLWNTSMVRGNSYDENTSLKTDVLTYSDSQLYEYVKMLKWCGFTGVQATDMCAAWAATSGYEFVQERIREMADAAHSLGMKFTLWVWASEFTGYGWVDDSVTYDKGTYEYQYQSPDVVATFEKYYGIYEELADVCDRMICHFYDPGNLETSQDVGYFSKLLMDEVHAINPDVDFGISCWVDAFDLGVILSYTGTDVTVYEGNCQSDGGIDGSFREKVYTFAARLGTWSWNTCGMEIDQLAAMQYQPNVIKETYQQMKAYDDIDRPTYWSEMDSYHILNAFSLYCCGSLLQDPDRDTEELTKEVAASAVGPEYADAFAEMLTLIEEARSGDSWDTFWWKSDNYVLKSDDYPAAEILEKCGRLIPILEEMIDAGVEGYEMPTPVSMTEILKMIEPHLKEIEEYATFRLAFDALKADLAAGSVDVGQASETLQEIAVPVHEYNTVIGVWGQIEARQQRLLVQNLCETYGMELPDYPYYNEIRRERIINALAMQQKGHTEPVSTWTYSADTAYGTEERALIDELIEEGIFTADEGVWYHLTNWQDYIYDFSD